MSVFTSTNSWQIDYIYDLKYKLEAWQDSKCQCGVHPRREYILTWHLNLCVDHVSDCMCFQQYFRQSETFNWYISKDFQWFVAIYSKGWCLEHAVCKLAKITRGCCPSPTGHTWTGNISVVAATPISIKDESQMQLNWTYMVDLQLLDSLFVSYFTTLVVQAESFLMHSFPSLTRTIPLLKAALKLKPFNSEQCYCNHPFHWNEAQGEACKAFKNRHRRSGPYC